MQASTDIRRPAQALLRKPRIENIERWTVSDRQQTISHLSEPSDRHQPQPSDLEPVIIDTFSISKFILYKETFESDFISDKPVREKFKGTRKRTDVVMLNCLCRYTDESILLNGQYNKEYGTFEIDIQTLKIVRTFNNYSCIDMKYIADRFFVFAISDSAGSSGVKKSVNIFDKKTDRLIYESKTKYSVKFFDNFQCKNRVLSVTNNGWIAFICEGDNSVAVLKIDMKKGEVSNSFNKEPIPVPSVVHVCLVDQKLIALGKDKTISVFGLMSGEKRSFSFQVPAEKGDDYLFTSLAANSKYIVVAGISKKTKTIGITLLLLNSLQHLGTQYMTDPVRIYPIYQLQLVKKGLTEHIIAMELYERVSILAIANNELRVVQGREFFFSEMITGISFFTSQRQKYAMIMGTSKFECWEV